MIDSVENLPAVETIEGSIRIIRGQRVMLDVDLAVLYGVETKRLNEQVRRNRARFPSDFMFRLTLSEWQGMWSQFATTSSNRRRSDATPYAFTEHGCLMLSNVLRSVRAVKVSVLIVRAFVRMRSALAANAELASKVDELAREVDRQGGRLDTHHAAIQQLLAEIRRMTKFPEPTHRGIGFTAKWDREPSVPRKTPPE